MSVAGFGFRTTATLDSLRSAFDLASQGQVITALASVNDKAQSPCLLALARELCLPIEGVPPVAMKTATTLTQSARVQQIRGTGSVAEATALIAAGDGARLVGPRHISPDRLATCAVASRGQT